MKKYEHILKRDAKEKMLIEKMREISEDGVIPCNRLEFIKEYGGCYKTINRIAQKEGLTFKNSCKSNHRTEQNVKKIKKMLESDPEMTYREIGDALGLTRQRAEQIIKEYGLKKQRKMRCVSHYKVKTLLNGHDELSKTNRIRELLMITDLTCTQIAEQTGSRVDYVSYINRRDNIRPKWWRKV